MSRFKFVFALAVTVLVIAYIAGVAFIANAAQGPGGSFAPAIVTFDADLDEVDFDAAEANGVPATLSWAALNLGASQRLVLEFYQGSGWRTLFDGSRDANEALPASGSRQVTVRHPLNFGAPTFRLIIKNTEEIILDERVLTLAFDADALEGRTPRIESFSPAIQRIDVNDLNIGTAQVPAMWRIVDRIPTAHVYFEQVLADGTTRALEMLRPQVWVPSTGDGLIIPAAGGGASITLRLRLADAVSGATYDQRDVTLPVDGTPAPTQIVTPSPAQIVYFRQGIGLPVVGAPFNVEWEARGASFVTLEWLDRSGAVVSNPFLPLNGTHGIDLSAVFVGAGNTHQFRLFATDVNGRALVDGAGRVIEAYLRVPAADPSAPVIESFSAAPASVSYGQSVRLTWSVQGATSIDIVRLDGSGNPRETLGSNLPASGSLDFTIPEIALPEDYPGFAQFQLRATGADGIARTASANVTVTPVQEAPRIVAFSASPNPVEQAGVVTLNWQTTGSNTVTLSFTGVTMPVIIGAGLPASGSTTYMLPPDFNGTATFTLAIDGVNTGIVPATTSVAVVPALPNDPVITVEPLPAEPLPEVTPQVG